MAEAGMPGFDISTWWGVLAPAKTPKAIVDKLNAAVNQAASAEHVRARLTQEGADAISGPPAEFQKALASELAMWRGVARMAGFKTE
jgi:tripartite-type tricarboxylate transporter receptor subunit TctC